MRRIVCAALLLLAGGCGNRNDRDARAAADTVGIDTSNRNPLDGLSRTQIEQRARPMTPEQAEQLGIIDTTITVEPQHRASQVEPGPEGFLMPAPHVVPVEP